MHQQKGTHHNKFKNPKLTPTHSKSLCGREGLSEFKCQAPNILFYAGLPTLHKVLDSQLHDTNKRNPNVKTSNNQRLGRVFHDLDPRLSLLCQVGDDVIRPCKICGGCQIRVPRPNSFTESTLSHTISTPISIRIAFLLRRTQK